MAVDFDKIDIKSVEKINVDEGDILAVYVKGILPAVQVEGFKASLEKLLSEKKVTVIVINADLIKLQVIRANA